MKLENSLYEIRLQMFRHGGAFVRQLAQCLGVADLENQEKIFAAFPEIMERYDSFATMERKDQPKMEEYQQ